MKLSTISATLAILASSVTAAPGLKPVEAREFSVYVTFNGADSDAYYTRSIPADGSVNILCKFLLVPHSAAYQVLPVPLVYNFNPSRQMTS